MSSDPRLDEHNSYAIPESLDSENRPSVSEASLTGLWKLFLPSREDAFSSSLSLMENCEAYTWSPFYGDTASSDGESQGSQSRPGSTIDTLASIWMCSWSIPVSRRWP